MQLRKLHPNSILSSPETGIQELMRSFLMRTNFVPGVRHVIGWRGLKDSSSDLIGWTAKIKGLSGVFGVYFDRLEIVAGWIGGQFGLNYFPDPDEELVESLSLQAGVYAQKNYYISHVRDFLSYPELSELFNIGTIELCVSQSEDALILGLESISRQRVIAKDGVSLTQQGRLVEIVEPGGCDQDFPSYDTAFAIYKVLAASFTFNLEEPPVYLNYTSEPGTEAVYDSSGNSWKRLSNESKRKYLFLGYGAVDFDDYVERKVGYAILRANTLLWKAGKEIPMEYKEALWWNAHKISDYKTLDKQILGIDERPQLIVLAGFLGSGKTSFLQHFIEYQVQLNRFVAVIQNEIGEIGLDGKLLDHDFSVTEIDEGCICCSLVGSLKSAIKKILSSFHPDFIVVETTGLANPSNLLDEIFELDDLVKFDSVTTVIDGLNVEKTLQEYGVVRKQIKAADVLLLNKRDLINTEQIESINQRLREINQAAPIILTEHGDINPALIYGVDPQDITGIKHQEEHKGEAQQIHPSHEYYGLSSCRMSFNRPLNREHFINSIKSLPTTIFRIKGVLDFVDTRESLLFQFVGGRFEFAQFNNPNLPERFLIFIGQGLQEESIKSVFSNLVSSNS
jgi:G3E family GTPase